jgi:hypothetical protein
MPLHRNSMRSGDVIQSGPSNTSYSTDELNDLLVCLSDIYPEHDISLRRKAILLASEKVSSTTCRLEVAAAALVDAVPGPRRQERLPKLEPWERFRLESYKTAVSKTL